MTDSVPPQRLQRATSLPPRERSASEAPSPHTARESTAPLTRSWSPRPLSSPPCVLVTGEQPEALGVIARAISGLKCKVVRREGLRGAVLDAERYNAAALLCHVESIGPGTHALMAHFARDPRVRERPIVLVSHDSDALDELVRHYPTNYRVLTNELESTGTRLLSRLLARTPSSLPGRSLRPSAPPPSPSATRMRLRERFFANMVQELGLAQRYLIGGVLGERAHEALRRTLEELKGEASLNGIGSVIVTALSHCEGLAEAAREDVVAMTKLAECCEWLTSLRPQTQLPHTLDELPLFRSAGRLTSAGG